MQDIPWGSTRVEGRGQSTVGRGEAECNAAPRRAQQAPRGSWGRELERGCWASARSPRPLISRQVRASLEGEPPWGRWLSSAEAICRGLTAEDHLPAALLAAGGTSPFLPRDGDLGDTSQQAPQCSKLFQKVCLSAFPPKGSAVIFELACMCFILETYPEEQPWRTGESDAGKEESHQRAVGHRAQSCSGPS